MIVWQRIKNALWAILGLLVGFLLFGKKKDDLEIKEAKKTVGESKKTVGEIIENKKRREHHAEELKEKLKKITTGTLILVLCLCFCLSVWATDYYIPETYEEAIEYYMAAVESALDYQEKYEQAEADNDRLLLINQELARQLEVMIQYKQSKQRFGLTAGVIMLDRPGFYIGITWSL